MRIDSCSSRIRPVLTGCRGAVSSAHPLATAAGQEVLAVGGNAVDATIAAQAALAVLLPEACGLGGDGLALIREPDGRITAVNGTGKSAADARAALVSDDGSSVTVPGLVGAWTEMSRRCGKLDLARVLAPAIQMAERGVRLGAGLGKAIEQQVARLKRGGAGDWAVISQGAAGARVIQSQLAATLRAIVKHGSAAFYNGPVARAVIDAVQKHGGYLSMDDMAAHQTVVKAPVILDWGGGRIAVQPPMAQGVLLAMCLKALDGLGELDREMLNHVAIELTEAAFAHRDEVAKGKDLLDVKLEIDLGRASRRGGPRPYLHTAGVAAADSDGFVVSSLVSIFDDFGAGIYVPQGGFVLNNRAQGFTGPPNEAAPAKRPVHTLAPCLLELENAVVGLATPGADGQVQILLQVLIKAIVEDRDIASAIDAPRWRSEDAQLLIGSSHPAIHRLSRLGHQALVIDDGDSRFGGVVCAGVERDIPFAVSDWRRECWSGVV